MTAPPPIGTIIDVRDGPINGMAAGLYTMQAHHPYVVDADTNDKRFIELARACFGPEFYRIPNMTEYHVQTAPGWDWWARRGFFFARLEDAVRFKLELSIKGWL